MARSESRLVIADLRGGRNGTDPPLALPMNQCTDAKNVDWYDGMLGRARPGATSVSLTGGTGFGSGIQRLTRYVPAADETLAELWGTDGAGLTKRLAAANWADVTVADAITTLPAGARGDAVVLNGLLFLGDNTAQDRLHCYDPSLSAPKVRRVGINPGTNAPTLANDVPAGAWPAVLRYYRVRFWQMNGSIVVRKSEPTPSASFTPSGINSATIITRPAAPNEDETHWTFEVSTDNVTWYALNAATKIVLATTTGADSSALSVYTGVSEPAGYFALWPSVQHLLTDGNRLLGATAWVANGAISGGKTSRIWFSPVLGSSDKGDAERVPNQTGQKNWVDLNENDGGGVTALMGPYNGMPLAGKLRRLHLLRPTGDVASPYAPRQISDWVGVVSGKAWCNGFDEAGAPAVYFLSTHGPYRYGANGLQYLGRDNEDIWSTLNLAATGVIAWCLYVPDLHQVWVHLATGANNDPNKRMIFDVLLGRPNEHEEVRGGWAEHTGDAPSSRCGCLFANTTGVSMSTDLKPYLGRSSGTTILKGNTSDKDDATVAYQSTLTTRPLMTAANLGQNYKVQEAHLLGRVNATDTITVGAVRDFGAETKSGTTGLVAIGSETRIQQRVENTDFEGGGVFQYTIGDGSALASNWVLDSLIVPVVTQEVR